ncbi:reverse transcriptase domain-containing protein [Tanacetum coccineum]
MSIVCFHLHLDIYNSSLSSLAEKWFHSLCFRKCFKKLSLTICGKKIAWHYNICSLTIPAEIFSYENLDTMIIIVDHLTNRVTVNMNLVMTKCLYLRVLELVNVRISSEEALNNLLSSCVFFEKINIFFCQDFKFIKVKNLRCLYELKIRLVAANINNIMEINDVPTLCVFHYRAASKYTFNMDSLGSVRELVLYRNGVDGAFINMVNSKFPFLDSLTLTLLECRVETIGITYHTLMRLTLKLCKDNQINIKVYASNLLYFSYDGLKMPTLLFPTNTPVHITLTLNFYDSNPIDLSFFMKMREALSLSSEFNIEIINLYVRLNINLDDLRRRVPSFPARNVQQLSFTRCSYIDMCEHSTLFNLFFLIFYPCYVNAHYWPSKNYRPLKCNNYLYKQNIRRMMEKKRHDLKDVEIKTLRNGNWESLANFHRSFHEEANDYNSDEFDDVLEGLTPDTVLRELCDKNYHQLLPLIAEKMQKENKQQDKMKAVKARLIYGDESKRNSTNREESHCSESKTPTAKSVSARSDTRYQSSHSRGTEALPKKHHHRGTSSQGTDGYSESEDSGGGHWKSKSRRHRMPSHVKTYDGSGDPEDHLKLFQSVAKTERWAMPTWCHMFNSTLTGNARVWFDSYEDLREAFHENYLQQKKHIKDSVEIHHIKQRDGESMEEFVERYKAKSMDVEGAPKCMKERSRLPVTNGKKAPLPWKQSDMGNKQNFKNGFTNQQRSEWKPDKFSLLTKTPKEIFALEKKKFKVPPPMVTPAEKRDPNKFCEFHEDIGHNTDECMQLRRQLEEMIKSEKLSQFIKELKQKDQSQAPKKEETFGKDKPLAILMVQPWKRVAKQRIIQSFSPELAISFPPLEEKDGTEGPMIIEIEMGGHFVHWMYVDGGASSEVLYEHCFSRFQPEVRSQMVPATAPLIGFSGETIWPLGQISLLETDIREKDEKLSKSGQNQARNGKARKSQSQIKAKLILHDKKNQSPAPTPVKAVEESCVTCGGAHSYQTCPATSGNVYRDNIQEYVSQAAAANYNQGNTGYRAPMSNQNNHNVQNQGNNRIVTTKNRGNFNQGTSLPTPRVHQESNLSPSVVSNLLLLSSSPPLSRSSTSDHGVSKNRIFDSYKKANDLIRGTMPEPRSNMQNQLTNLTDMLSKFVTSNTASTSELSLVTTVTNQKEDLKEREPEVTKDTMLPTNNGSTEDIPPYRYVPIISYAIDFEPDTEYLNSLGRNS